MAEPSSRGEKRGRESLLSPFDTRSFREPLPSQRCLPTQALRRPLRPGRPSEWAAAHHRLPQRLQFRLRPVDLSDPRRRGERARQAVKAGERLQSWLPDGNLTYWGRTEAPGRVHLRKIGGEWLEEDRLEDLTLFLVRCSAGSHALPGLPTRVD